MWTPEIAQLKTGTTIVVELSLDCLNYALYSYVLVGHIYNFDSWRNRYKNLALFGKNKMR